MVRSFATSDSPKPETLNPKPPDVLQARSELHHMGIDFHPSPKVLDEKL